MNLVKPVERKGTQTVMNNEQSPTANRLAEECLFIINESGPWGVLPIVFSHESKKGGAELLSPPRPLGWA